MLGLLIMIILFVTISLFLGTIEIISYADYEEWARREIEAVDALKQTNPTTHGA